MDEYIKRADVLALLEERREFLFKENGDYDHYSNGFDEAVDKVENFPIAADVVERKRGEWVWKHRHHGGFRKYTGIDEFGETHTITVDERIECDEPYCPYCGKWNESVYLSYCPNCGAKLKKKITFRKETVFDHPSNGCEFEQKRVRSYAVADWNRRVGE